METSWDRVSDRKKQKADRELSILAKKIVQKHGHVSPSFTTKAFFAIMRLAQKHGWNEVDSVYWKDKGWTGKVRPWNRQ